MQKINISVIIPTYNRANIISRAIESVLNQTFSNWELIVVDDGSTDDTKEIVEQYLAEKRIRYFYQENKGVCAARNLGAGKANGDYLAFLDSDDCSSCNWLSKVNDVIQMSKADVITNGVTVIKGRSSIMRMPNKKHELFKEYFGLFLAGTFVLRKYLFMQVGGYDSQLSYSENMELSLRVFKTTPVQKTINEQLIEYFQSESNPSRSFLVRARNLTYILKKHKTIFLNNKMVFSKQLYLLAYLLHKSEKPLIGNRVLKISLKLNPFNYKSLILLIRRQYFIRW